MGRAVMINSSSMGVGARSSTQNRAVTVQGGVVAPLFFHYEVSRTPIAVAIKKGAANAAT